MFAGFVLCCWRGDVIAGSSILPFSSFFLLGERLRGIVLCCIMLSESEDEDGMCSYTPA